MPPTSWQGTSPQSTDGPVPMEVEVDREKNKTRCRVRKPQQFLLDPRDYRVHSAEVVDGQSFNLQALERHLSTDLLSY